MMMYIKVDFFPLFSLAMTNLPYNMDCGYYINGKALVYNTHCWNWNKNWTMKLVFSRLGIEIGIVKKKGLKTKLRPLS
jgi:hypothetical protein